MDMDELLIEAGEAATCVSICQFLVHGLLRCGRERDALGLLRACKEESIRQNDGTYAMSVSWQIAQLCENQDVVALRDELFYLLRNVPRSDVPLGTVELWDRIRKTYDQDAWLRERDAMLRRIDKASVRRQCLAAEGLYEWLMDEVEADGCYVLGGYEQALAERFPQRVLDLYLASLEDWRTRPGNSRKSYQALARHLCHIKGLRGGEKKVQRFVAELRELYPRRRALLDELSRV